MDYSIITDKTFNTAGSFTVAPSTSSDFRVGKACATKCGMVNFF